jgi:serine protease AprX
MAHALWTRVRSFLERENVAIEDLKKKLGDEVADKFDSVVLRDLFFEARLQKEGPSSSGKLHRVVLNLDLQLPALEQWPATSDMEGRARAAEELERSNRVKTSAFSGVVVAAGGRVEQELWLPCSLIVSVTDQQLFELANRGEVKSVQHVKEMPALLLDTSRPFIHGNDVENDLHIVGQGIEVAVVDTGIDFGHGSLTAAKGGQFDFTGEGDRDKSGHGTFCAGIIGSRDAKFRGISPGARLHAYKIMSQEHLLSAPVAEMALREAVARRVHVINCSWGFSHAGGKWKCKRGDCILCHAVDAAVALGAVVVVGAGNEGKKGSAKHTRIRCPGNAEQAITVGASKENGDLLGNTSAGPTPDGRPKPDLVAPGNEVLSTEAGTTKDFLDLSGTSAACAHVAGVSALLLEANSSLTPRKLKDALKVTATDLRLDPKEPERMGKGVVHAKGAVDAVRSQSHPAALGRRRHG